MDFNVRPLSFWRRQPNHLIEFEVKRISREIGTAGFAAKYGGGVILLINRELAEHMIDRLDVTAPCLIAFEAEFGGSSTLVINEEMRTKMLAELRAFLDPSARPTSQTAQ
ncbi:hypothetical protein [Bradyrhizobium lablabi]|uniref:hypothetical protein n=1 Tax=Bradyrhizobium lablabi TaxID=722472 RepID=UPI001BA91901|nr:hypothetical protein [Bradyrhizobium lablabi]MBR0696530.1 hypothetical protein [Bradyrhizobium lablabi]